MSTATMKLAAAVLSFAPVALVVTGLALTFLPFLGMIGAALFGFGLAAFIPCIVLAIVLTETAIQRERREDRAAGIFY